MIELHKQTSDGEVDYGYILTLPSGVKVLEGDGFDSEAGVLQFLDEVAVSLGDRVLSRTYSD